jgi:hypothetical protein
VTGDPKRHITAAAIPTAISAFNSAIARSRWVRSAPARAMAEDEACVPVANSPPTKLAAMTSASSARATAGVSALAPGDVADGACDSMLTMALFLLAIAEAAQIRAQSYNAPVGRAILYDDDNS